MIGMIEICSRYPNQVSEVSQAPRETYKNISPKRRAKTGFVLNMLSVRRWPSRKQPARRKSVGVIADFHYLLKSCRPMLLLSLVQYVV